MSTAPSRIVVAVTGNAGSPSVTTFLSVTDDALKPFWGYQVNTSSLVRTALPTTITTTEGREVLILKYAQTTIDTYADVRQVSRDIWEGTRDMFLPEPEEGETAAKVDVDLIVHLGIEVRKEHFNFETRARRGGYSQPGDDGEYVDSETLKSLGLPGILCVKLDVPRAANRVKERFPDIPIIVSEDAGLHFCEFRLSSSLAEAELQYPEKRGRVVFVHIPQQHDQEAIELATALTTAYIRALAEDDLFVAQTL